MRNKNNILSMIVLLVLSEALCFAAYYASTLATQYDLGQLAYLFFIFFPITAVVIGMLANTTTGRWWLAPIGSLIAFTAFMLIMYKTVNIAYVLVYILISVAGYYLSYIVKRIIKR